MSTDIVWFKSSYSDSEGECVDIALEWSKSSHSGSEGECLEIALSRTALHIRDSKTPTARTIAVSPAAWSAFLPRVRATGDAAPASG
ncbi:DUF397 domain-containing protein [Streptomyces sp. MUM 2J]|uniref:DUF397 domain-containing protein n=1 Tax=Streptomyces sp. MUM 2J TaxID=2791987 RepID=UPI001F04E019|nr:DUF397 domain-containing protein [Streptomyces sp. MUM 2J]MCH0562033.1 DUF397 domain-containing protein [Streptomyces sp. MUM 2J]